MNAIQQSGRRTWQLTRPMVEIVWYSEAMTAGDPVNKMLPQWLKTSGLGANRYLLSAWDCSSVKSRPLGLGSELHAKRVVPG